MRIYFDLPMAIGFQAYLFEFQSRSNRLPTAGYHQLIHPKGFRLAIHLIGSGNIALDYPFLSSRLPLLPISLRHRGEYPAPVS